MEKTKLHSHLEAAGAEILVVGNLLIRGIECYKAYTNYPDYDLTAINQEKTKAITIQVKSRWATNRAGNFPIKSLECDFVVHVALNRGIRKARETISNEAQQPDFYIFPIKVIEKYRSQSNKVNIKNIPDYDKYLNNWELIEKLLQANKV